MTSIRHAPAAYHQPFAYLEIGDADPERISRQCVESVGCGVAGVYLGDALFRYLPSDAVRDDDTVVMAEPGGVIVTRPDEQADRLRATFEAHGLALHGVHFTQSLPPPGEPLEWLWPRLQLMLDTAARLGVNYVTTHPGWMYGAAHPDYTGDVARDWIAGRTTQAEFLAGCRAAYGLDRLWLDSVAVYRRLCADAADRGIRVTVETAIAEWPELTDSPERIHAFIDDVGADNLGICIDPGHCQIHGLDPAAIIRDCGNRLWDTHFHDNFGDADSHYPIGIGRLDWRDIVQALVDIDYRGDMTFECRDTATCATNWSHIVHAWEHAV